MATLEWKDSYSVGDDRMDGQHRGLIALINKLDENPDTGEVLERLQYYADVHFREEEALLESVDYPDLAEQKREHASFEEWLAAQQKAFASGDGTDELLEGVRRYLRVWLTNHILFSDQAYSAYID